MRTIRNTNDAIEAYTDTYALQLEAAGTTPSELALSTYREMLKTLVQLARSEYQVEVNRDMVQASKALK